MKWMVKPGDISLVRPRRFVHYSAHTAAVEADHRLWG